MTSLFADLFPLATLSLHIKRVWIKDTDEVISDDLRVKRLDRIKASSISTTLQSFPRLNWIEFSRLVLPPVIHVSPLSGVLGIFSGPALSSQAFGLTSLIWPASHITDNWFLTVSWWYLAAPTTCFALQHSFHSRPLDLWLDILGHRVIWIVIWKVYSAFKKYSPSNCFPLLLLL